MVCILQYFKKAYIMNSVRYFGLYRPMGFKRNVFNLFYTRHPSYHLKKHYQISNKGDHQDLDELCDIFNIPQSLIIYSKESYPNYKQLHKKLVKHLKNQGHGVSSLKLRGTGDTFPVFPGKYIEFDNRKLPPVLDLDDYIKQM